MKRILAIALLVPTVAFGDASEPPPMPAVDAERLCHVNGVALIPPAGYCAV